jgi:hypothetical protein
MRLVDDDEIELALDEALGVLALFFGGSAGAAARFFGRAGDTGRGRGVGPPCRSL